MHRLYFFLLPILVGSATVAQSVTFEGETRCWHRLTLTFQGPWACETGSPNPFLDYRLEVTFTDGSSTYVVPGFFAADGDAAETGADCGDRWRVHFTPGTTGNWTWTASFVQGAGAAVNPWAGTPAAFDGASGSFHAYASDKTGDDFRHKGRLDYRNRRYLKFIGTKDYFIMTGAGSPENFLAYQEFDGTFNESGTDYTKSYAPHAADWNPGDPTWQGGQGKGIIGAVNYLASQGVNSHYFLTFNADGDGDDVWPWILPASYDRFDVSKLDQWGIVFGYMDRKGIVKHVVTQEQENDQHLDGGNLGTDRKLYYRELVARFGHLLGLIWNLGEENTCSDWQVKQHASYLRSIDPYDHLIQTHTHTFEKDAVYAPLLGYPDYEGASLQVANPSFADDDTNDWIRQSEDAGRPWAVFLSEIGPANAGVMPDADDPGHDEVRRGFLWNHLLHGGAGVEWYFGYNYAHNDLTCEDYRSRDNMWAQSRIAREFFETIPFHRMASRDDLVSRWDTYCFALPGKLYIVQVPDNDYTDLTLEEPGAYYMAWFDPRNGGELIDVETFTNATPGGTWRIQNPPTDEDWIAVVLRHDAAASMRIGLEMIEARSGELYPNPTAGRVTVELAATSSRDDVTVQLFDLGGKPVFTATRPMAPSFELDLGETPEGLYVYVVRTGGRILDRGRLVRMRE